jgi:hypothetical protein
LWRASILKLDEVEVKIVLPGLIDALTRDELALK